MASEAEKGSAPPLAAKEAAQPPEFKDSPVGVPQRDYFVVGDVVLRVLLFASTLVAVLVMVTSKQGMAVRLPIPPLFPMRIVYAKFTNSPAFVYFVVALSVACFHSIVTTLLSIFNLLKPGFSTKFLPHFVFFDVLILGIVAAAAGAAGGVGYIGLKGNSHTGWLQVCDNFDKFCQHLAGSIVVSLLASVLLVFLVLLSVYTLSRKIPK